MLLNPFFKDAVHNSQTAWRKVVATSATLGIPTPAFSTALAFYDSYRSARLPANLLQVNFPWPTCYFIVIFFTFFKIVHIIVRPNVTILVLIHTSCWQLLENISTQTGLVLVVMCQRAHTKRRRMKHQWAINYLIYGDQTFDMCLYMLYTHKLCKFLYLKKFHVIYFIIFNFQTIKTKVVFLP